MESKGQSGNRQRWFIGFWNRNLILGQAASVQRSHFFARCSHMRLKVNDNELTTLG